MLVVSAWTTYSMLRLVLGTWTPWRLCRAIPLMRILQQQRAFRHEPLVRPYCEAREGPGRCLVARIHQPIVPGCGASKRPILFELDVLSVLLVYASPGRHSDRGETVA